VSNMRGIRKVSEQLREEFEIEGGEQIGSDLHSKVDTGRTDGRNAGSGGDESGEGRAGEGNSMRRGEDDSNNDSNDSDTFKKRSTIEYERWHSAKTNRSAMLMASTGKPLLQTTTTEAQADSTDGNIIINSSYYYSQCNHLNSITEFKLKINYIKSIINEQTLFATVNAIKAILYQDSKKRYPQPGPFVFKTKFLKQQASTTVKSYIPVCFWTRCAATKNCKYMISNWQMQRWRTSLGSPTITRQESWPRSGTRCLGR
jgi:hypothetical protein